MSFVPEAITLNGKFTVERSAPQAFSLFSPRGEEAWVPGWKPELLHPAGVEWETGLVFRTIHEDQESVWFVRNLSRERFSVTYDRVDLGLAAATVSVTCRDIGDQQTEVSVSYRFVGISEAGNEFIRQLTKDDFAAKMLRWRDAIAALDAR